MATVAEPTIALPEATPARRRSMLRRPTGSPKGVWGWMTTVDHKKIGILYGVTAGIFFLIGGTEALVLRVQLGAPDQTLVSADQYNQLFTMHGTTMIFLVIMPLSAGFANYLVPLMIGARDVAFPRLNAFGYWVFLVGGLFDMNTDNLRRWLHNPPGEKPGARMPNLNLAPQEITQLIAYLQTLE